MLFIFLFYSEILCFACSAIVTARDRCGDDTIESEAQWQIIKIINTNQHIPISTMAANLTFFAGTFIQPATHGIIRTHHCSYVRTSNNYTYELIYMAGKHIYVFEIYEHAFFASTYLWSCCFSGLLQPNEEHGEIGICTIVQATWEPCSSRVHCLVRASRLVSHTTDNIVHWSMEAEQYAYPWHKWRCAHTNQIRKFIVQAPFLRLINIKE